MNIGILGGSFDPIHEGHLYIARRSRQILGLDQVILMVARVPPHKRLSVVASPFHRYAMVALASQEEEGIVAGSWELEQEGPSYTIRTLRWFTDQHPGSQYSFIGGWDSLKELYQWKDYDKLLEEFSLVFFHRSGAGNDVSSLRFPDELKGRLQTVCENDKLSIQRGTSYLIRSDPPAVSSTEIRGILAAGKQPGPGLLSPRVLQYIQKYQLYE